MDALDTIAGSPGLKTGLFDFLDGPDSKGNYTKGSAREAVAANEKLHGADDYKDFVEAGGGFIKATDKPKEVALGDRGATATVGGKETKSAVDQSNSKQEANDDGITNNYEEPADFSWVSGNADEKDDKGYDLDTYIFSKGMLEGNQLDDYGNPMGWYGNIETPVSLKQQAEADLKYTKKDTPRYEKLTKDIEAYDKAINAYQKYVDTFKANYEADENKNKYDQKYEQKEDIVKESEAAKTWLSEKEDDVFEKQQEYSKLLMSKGIDWVDYDKVLDDKGIEYSIGDNVRIGKKPYTVEKADDVETVIKDRFGESYAVSKDGNTVSHKTGSYSGESKGFAKTYINTEEGWKEYDKLTGKTSNISSSFAKTLSQTLDQVVSSVNGSSYPSDVVDAAKAVREAEKMADIAGYRMDLARKAEVEATHGRAKVLQQETMDEYAAGKISAFEAANRLANIKDSMLDFNMSSIVSKINPEVDLGIAASVGSIDKDASGRDIISKGAFEYDLSNPTEPGTASLISSIEDLVELRKRIDNIDVSTIKSEEDSYKAVDLVNEITSQYAKVANTKFEDLVTSLLKTGGELQEIKSNPDFRTLTQSVYNDAQAAYDKVSEIEAYTEKFGLNNLTKRDIKQNLGHISQKVDELQERVGTYYSPGSNLEGKGSSGVELSTEEINALANYSKSIISTKDACIALMKSAAFNGAEDTVGGKYSEAWKNAQSVEVDKTFKGGAKAFVNKGQSEKLTWKDWFASGTKGTLGTVATVVGGVMLAANPIIGTMLMISGLAASGKAALDVGTKLVASQSTNRDKMFANQGTGGSTIKAENTVPENEFQIGDKVVNKITAKDVINDIGNRTTETANFGDIKSVGTHTKTSGAFISIIAGLSTLSYGNPAGLLAVIDGVNELRTGMKGGLENNLDTAISNIYQLGSNIVNWSNANINIDEFMKDPNSETALMQTPEGDATPIEIKPKEEIESAYGSADTAENAEGKYSGYVEDAKNKNLATDYNAGMEENVNEAVSDKYVKVFKVMLDKEPDYIKKVLIAIPKTHAEREWK